MEKNEKKNRLEQRKTTDEILTMDDVKKLATVTPDISHRTGIYVLFDGGLRGKELLSIRKEDITYEYYSKDKKCFWVKCNANTAKERKIPVPLFTKAIKNFVNSSQYKHLKNNDLIWNQDSKSLSQHIKNVCEKVLPRKNISLHLFRHSSATYWAEKLNGDTVKLAKRYGWTIDPTLGKYMKM